MKKDPLLIPLELYKLGFSVYVIVADMSDQVAALPFNVYLTKNSRHLHISSNVREFWKVLNLLLEIKPQFAICYNTSFANPFVVLAFRLLRRFYFKGSKTRFILKMDSDGTFKDRVFLAEIQKAVTLLNSCFFDEIIIESSCGFQMISNFVLNCRKLHVIPNGYSGLADSPIPYGNHRGQSILSVGRITPSKGIDILIRSFLQVSEDFANWRLVIAGPIEDTSYYLRLKNLIPLDARNKVVFLGKVSESTLRELYYNSAIFCSLSLREGFSIARLEALAYGLPVVTSEAGCGRDLKGAIVVPTNDITESSRQLRRLMNDEGLRKMIVEEEQKHIKTWHEIVIEILKVSGYGAVSFKET